MVGVVLVSMRTIMASSMKASLSTTLDSPVWADYVVTGRPAGGSTGFGPRSNARSMDSHR